MVDRFLNQAHWPMASAPGFLKLFLCRRLYLDVVSMCACVSGLKAINN